MHKHLPLHELQAHHNLDQCTEERQLQLHPPSLENVLFRIVSMVSTVCWYNLCLEVASQATEYEAYGRRCVNEI